MRWSCFPSKDRKRSRFRSGLTTLWHENGQKQAEVIWKDGELVSKKLWNSKGEEVETPAEADE